jgi:hypothetical protein
VQFKELRKLMEHDRAKLPREVKDGLERTLDGVFDTIREQRNDAGHPTGFIPDRAVVYATITVFPTYLAKIHEVIHWLNGQPAGSL